MTAQQSPDAVSKITPAGVITEYPLMSGAHPGLDMTLGPDGNVWALINSAEPTNQLAKITPAGVITYYSLRTVNPNGQGPRQLTVGPDNKLWMTYTLSRRIARFDPDTHTLMECDVPGDDALTGLSAGPNGALWFTECNDSVFGRIETTGVITMVEPWDDVSCAGPLTTDKDGVLWFADQTHMVKVAIS